MKKDYIKPAVCTQRIETESLLATESGQINTSYARGNDSWDEANSKPSSSLSIKDVWE